jgi:hypothetical protein
MRLSTIDVGLLPILLIGCAAADAAPGATARDSAGVELVVNVASVESLPVLRIGEDPLLVVGVVAGEEAYQLDGVQWASWLADGSVAVANGGSAEVRIFDGAGLHVATHGRRGDGPGEFQVPKRVWQHADSLLVWDWVTNRITFIPPDGGAPRVLVPTVPPPGRSYNQEAWRLDGHLLLPLQDLVNAEPGTLIPIQIRYAAVSLHDGAVDTLMSVPAGRHGFMQITVQGRDAIMFGAPLFQGMTHATVAGARIFAGSSLRPAVARYAADGTLEREIQWSAQGTPVTAELRSIFREERAAATDDPNGMRASIDALAAADSFPHFDDLITDDGDRLWVRLPAIPGDDAPTRWIIHDTTGARVAVVEAPDDLSIYQAREDRVLGMRTDSLGVQQVVVLPILAVEARR